jgi:hypothetical protein
MGRWSLIAGVRERHKGGKARGPIERYHRIPELHGLRALTIHSFVSAGDFVGWGGVGPITVLLEYVFGIRADVPQAKLVWDIRLLERFGVERYAFGVDGVLSLQCEARSIATDLPVVHITSNIDLTVEVLWGSVASHIGGQLNPRKETSAFRRIIHVEANK